MKYTARGSVRRTLTFVLTSAAALTGGLIPFAATAQAATCTTYYVSSSSGSDSNSGCSSSSPWQTLTNVNNTTFVAGDQILFQDGGSWTGTLHPLGSGASGSPIVVSNYGSGSAPIIAGGGAAEAVFLDNQQYVTIQNLEITNTTTTAAVRAGVLVQNDTSGILNGITIQNNNIHDVLGYWNTSMGQPSNDAGIGFNLNDSFTTNGWDGVTISGNTLTKVDASGIYIGSVAGKNHNIVTSNVVVQNNTMTNAGGNDIVCVFCSGAVVQNNVATDNGYRYSGAGFWTAVSNNGLWQYNDISDQWRNYVDGQAFDFDWNTNGNIMQYNYTHNNPFGFMEFCCSNTAGSTNSVIRYNISQNDGGLNAVFGTLGGATSSGTTQLYNNTVYMGPGDNGAITAGSANGSNMYFENNIIYDLGNGGYSSAGNWSHNLFYGNHPSSEPADPNKITSNPMFVSPGGGGSTLASAAAYELQPGSPAIGAGAVISNNGGKDYFSNLVSSTSAPNIGAYNGGGVTPSPIKSGAFWPLSEGTGTTAFDQTNDHNTGTLQAGASWTTGATEPNAVALTGASNSYVDVPEPVINTGSSYTVSAWVKLNSTSGNNQTFASIDGSSISPFYLQLQAGVFSFTLRSSDSTSSTATLVTGLAPSTGTWYQVTGVYNASNSTASLYVNGVLQSSKAFSSAWTANGHTTIGRAKWNGNNVDFTNGAIGDVRVFNSALTSHDVLALGTGAAAYFPFTEGTGTSTGNLIQNTAPADFTGDAVWTGSGNPTANSVSLDGTLGTTAYSPVATMNTAGSYAMSVWVKFNSISSNSNNTFLSEDGTGAQRTTVSPFYLQLASGKFTFVQRTSNSTSSSASVITGPPATTGTWYNVIAEYNVSTGTASLYVNGSLAGTDSFTSPWAGGSVQFGDAVWGGLQADPTNAEIDDAVFYNRVLTSTEISELTAG